MFVTHNLHAAGKEINEVAAKIGLKAGESVLESSLPAIAGNTYQFKEQLKAAGFRFNGADKCWTCESFEQRDATICAMAGL